VFWAFIKLLRRCIISVLIRCVITASALTFFRSYYVSYYGFGAYVFRLSIKGLIRGCHQMMTGVIKGVIKSRARRIRWVIKGVLVAGGPNICLKNLSDESLRFLHLNTTSITRFIK
jgi:hypothetical protein